MKIFNLIMLFFGGLFVFSNAAAQSNASINILTQNSGKVAVGGVVNIEVTVGNTGPVTPIAQFKVRAQISVPIAICNILPAAQQTGLPAGWTISAYVGGGSAITVCNGTDVIPVGVARTILIKVQGNLVGGPSTVTGNLLFSNGVSCTVPGTLPGDNTADNSSTSSIQVLATLPLKLIGFHAKSVNCKPVLNWITENEINTHSFEIEKSNLNNTSWVTTGSVPANGNASGKSEYFFTDSVMILSSDQLFYRLKMIDKDGRFGYSNTVHILSNCKTPAFEVYPNPVRHGKLHVELAGMDGAIEATLVNLSGQLVLKTKLNTSRNDLNVSNIASGEYLLNIKNTSGFQKTVVVFIQH